MKEPSALVFIHETLAQRMARRNGKSVERGFHSRNGDCAFSVAREWSGGEWRNLHVPPKCSHKECHAQYKAQVSR